MTLCDNQDETVRQAGNVLGERAYNRRVAPVRAMEAVAAGTGPSSASTRRWRAFALLAVAFFMTIIDLAIVNVALPTIGRKLHFAESDLQWVVTAYGLTFGGFLLLGGRAADLLGRRRLLMVGLAIFTSTSLACGLATTDTFLSPSRYRGLRRSTRPDRRAPVGTLGMRPDGPGRRPRDVPPGSGVGDGQGRLHLAPISLSSPRHRSKTPNQQLKWRQDKCQFENLLGQRRS